MKAFIRLHGVYVAFWLVVWASSVWPTWYLLWRIADRLK